jgi:hypothetical protein
MRDFRGRDSLPSPWDSFESRFGAGSESCGSPPNKRLQLTAARLGCCAESHGRQPPVRWLTRGGRRIDTRRYAGPRQLNRDPLGGGAERGYP